MSPPVPQIIRRRRKRRGFALVVSITLMLLITMLALGLLSLSAIELRRSASGRDRAEARANARLALTNAIGQLQREMGPDQRVSATSGILGSGKKAHWTGVWSTRRNDGSDYVKRDPDSGSLVDSRVGEAWDAESEARAWLVSGGVNPSDALGSRERIELVGDGSVSEEIDRIEVPLVGLPGEGKRQGKMGWWTGDLGVRANISTHDRFAEKDPDPAAPDEGYYRLLSSQQNSSELLGEGLSIENRDRALLASSGSVDLADADGSAWSRRHFHDYTVSSRGVLADVRDGGLKSDLTAFFNSPGRVEGYKGLAGLADSDPILVSSDASRHQVAGPRFGLLRDWAGSTVPFSGEDVAAILPELKPGGDPRSNELALCNINPSRLEGSTSAGLQPVLVEASNFLQVSCFQIASKPYPRFQLRHHFYPRVVLWNPYNVEMKFDPAMVMIQGNGRQEMWTENEHYNGDGRVIFRSRAQWLSFEGGRSTSFFSDEEGNNTPLMNSKGYNDPYMGSYYFSIPETTFGPGECLVFSPARSAEYDGLSTYREGSYDLANNELSCEVSPDASRSFFVSGTDIAEDGMSFRPMRFWYAPTPYWSSDGRGVENQSDDTRVVMKKLDRSTSSAVTFEAFDALPQVSYLSASLQFGAGREPRIAWDDSSPMDIELLERSDPTPRIEPDVRTREGIRMRWFEEHQSNIQNAGGLANQGQFFHEAPMANWNPRASYSVRSPWENLGGSLPSVGSAGGPWFFGIYTRDLYDEDVSWSGQVPVYRDGRYHGNPFGPPQEGQDRHVMFELPRAETGVLSLGQLQNAKLSEFVWHPSFALGNSLVDPRLGLDGMNRTIPPTDSSSEEELGGFHRNAIGWSADSERSAGRDDWAKMARALLQDTPNEDHVVYDLSYEVNHAMWDRYFVSSGQELEKSKFLEDSMANPLPNGRMSLSPTTMGDASDKRLSGFQTAAYHLMVDGAFNVNSTSVDAWKAVLAATRGTGLDDGTPFTRVLNPVSGAHRFGALADDESAWSGFRSLSDEEIELLAAEIVEQVKERGPFLSMSDFVNRRLSNDDFGRSGALQTAIDRSGINDTFESSYRLENQAPLGDYSHPDNIKDSTRIEQTLKPDTMAWGAPGFLTQGDVLQILAPSISVRSDTFVVRAYGESSDEGGKVLARAWCEAIVQRAPVPIHADPSGLNSEKLGESDDFGRSFELVSFRWLRPEEV